MSPKPSRLSRLRGSLLAGAIALGLTATIGGQALLSAPTPALAQSTAQTAPIQRAVAVPSFADVVERVRPAVVSIRVRGEDRTARSMGMESMPEVPEGSPLERFFREYGMPGMPRGERGPSRPVMGQGSGFFISADGKVVTNYHVVKDAEEVTVVLDDKREFRAKVLGTDERTDIALLKVDAPNVSFPTVPLAAAEARVGDWVVAIGNPFGLGGTVTAGIVSARGRDIGAGPYDDFMQIDAPINRGNSGGPTFALTGEVVGVNTAIYSPSGGSVGIGFAIPAETVKRVVAQLERTGTVTRGWLGVQIQPITKDIADGLGLPDVKGALVAEPQRNSPAARAGLKAGDAIRAVDGQSVDTPRDLSRRIADIEPGKETRLTIWRDGKQETVTVTLGKLPTADRLAGAQPGDPAGAEATSLAALGLQVSPAQGSEGLVITRIRQGSEAARRGLRVGDVILEAQGEALASAGDLVEAMNAARADGRRSVLLRVQNESGGNARFVALPLAQS